MRRTVVEAPASSANLGPGFDTLAIALEGPLDRLGASFERSTHIGIEISTPGTMNIPLDPRKNTAGVVAASMSRSAGRKGKIVLSIEKKVPVGIGIGSSAASGAACALAMNSLLGLNLNREELVRYAGEGEAVASGSAHYDNVSAAIYGGFVVVSGRERLSIARIDAPAALRICVATPTVELPERKTEYARSVIPQKVGLRQMVSNVAKASTLVAGFAKRDITMIGEGMKDEVVEPARSKLIPGYNRVRKLAREAGASGVCISGAGPSMLAAVDSEKTGPKEVLAAMLEGFRGAGVTAEGFVTRAGEGARVVENS